MTVYLVISMPKIPCVYTPHTGSGQPYLHEPSMTVSMAMLNTKTKISVHAEYS